ncbi:MAG: hypothetical protein J1E85_10515 [Ruminococcus sp.]|nr:hypothetical protein [Ruminococcus sp.]
MNEENKNSIIYDEGWKSIADAEYPQLVSGNNDEYEEDYDSDEENNIPYKKKDGPKQLLITFQLILCIAVALVAFALKSIGGEVYETAREWYYTNLNSSAIFDESQNFDFNSIFGAATQDEAKNT